MCQFVHLHNHTKYSLLDGAITPQLLLPRLSALGMNTFAITDHGTMAGIPEFTKLANKSGVKIIAGCEMYEVDNIAHKTAEEASDTASMTCETTSSKADERNESIDLYAKQNPRYWHITLLARNYAGYHKLTRLTAAAATKQAYYYKPRIDREMLKTIAAGNDIVVGLGCALSRLSQYCLARDEYQGWSDRVDEYMKIFGEENVFCEIMANGFDGQAIINQKTVEWAERKGLAIVPTNDCHYVEEEHARLQDILLCIATNQKVNEERKFKFEGSSYFVRSPEQMVAAFVAQYNINVSPWMSNSILFADKCEHSGYIDDKVFRLPSFRIPSGETRTDFRNWVANNREKKEKRYGQVVEEVINENCF